MTVGDIILTRNKGFLPKGIQFFMSKYRKKLGLPKAKTYNHAAICVENDGDVLIAESMIKGVQIIHTPEEYLSLHPDHKILTWKEPLIETEQEFISDIAVDYSLKVTRYDFINFIPQMRMILFGAWTGKTGEKSKKRLYCSELVAVCMDAVRNSFNGVTWDKNPLDIELSEELYERN